MSSKWSKGPGASFRKAKRLKILAADGEICDKITSFFTAVAPIATPPIASVADQTECTDCETKYPVKYPVAIEPLEPPVPTSKLLLPVTAVSVELHPDECHPQEHPGSKIESMSSHRRTRNTSNEVFTIHFRIMFCQSCALASAFTIGLSSFLPIHLKIYNQHAMYTKFLHAWNQNRQCKDSSKFGRKDGLTWWIVLIQLLML